MLLLAWDDLPQISQIYTDGLSAKDPPTDYTEFTEPLAGDVLPQIARIYTDAANFRGCTCLRSALPLARARSAPTKQARTDCLLVKFNNGFIGLNGFDGCVKLTTD